MKLSNEHRPTFPLPMTALNTKAQQLVDQFAEQGLPCRQHSPSGIFGPDDPHFGPVLQLFKGRRCGLAAIALPALSTWTT